MYDIDYQLARIQPLLARQACDLAPLETLPLRALTEADDVSKTRVLASVQGNAICTWLANRAHQKGVCIKQQVSVGGVIFKRTVKARITVKTW